MRTPHISSMMNQEWRFLDLSSVDDKTARLNRSAVRSHVTRRQHRLARQKENATSPNCGSPPKQAERWAESKPISPAVRGPGRRFLSGSGKKRQSSRAVVKVKTEPVLPAVPRNGSQEPFGCYPVPFDPSYDRLLHHMMTVFAPRGWPALKIDTQQGLAWEWFMTQHALAEPALFYVRLLFASGDMIKLNVLPPQSSVRLQYLAVKAINEALSDEVRAKSDAMILAVGRIALHESLYGDQEAAHRLHRPAQARMIAMRGGIDALDFPPLVKRLMRWADDVMARQGGTQRLLEVGDEKDNFSLSERIAVLEAWSKPEKLTPPRSMHKALPMEELSKREEVAD